MTFHEVAVCGFNNNVTLLKDKQHNKINGIRTSGNSWHYASELFFWHLSERSTPKQYMCFAQYFLSKSSWLDM